LYKLKKEEENMKNEIVICPECGTPCEAPIDAICTDCQADQAAFSADVDQWLESDA
jgi:rubrerythrin